MEKKSFSGRIRAFIKRKKYNEYLEGCSTKFELLFCILAYRNEQNNELRRKVANKVFLKTLEDTPEEDLIQIVPQGKTLLMVACEKNIGYDIVLALRTRLPNSEIFKVHKLYGHTSTALMLACGNDAPTEIIEMLMRDSPDDYLEVVNMGVTTAIRIACRYTTQVETMRLLLSRSNKHKLIENEEDTPNYALIIAMLMRAKRCPGLVECIWEATSLEYKKKIDSSGCSILFYGCKKGVHVDDLQLLLKDLPMSYRKLQDNDGRTPLHYLATSTCALEKLELVLNDVEEPFRSLQDRRGRTALDFITDDPSFKLELFRRLIKDYGWRMQLNQPNTKGLRICLMDYFEEQIEETNITLLHIVENTKNTIDHFHFCESVVMGASLWMETYDVCFPKSV